jgi:hypothetical protein
MAEKNAKEITEAHSPMVVIDNELYAKFSSDHSEIDGLDDAIFHSVANVKHTSRKVARKNEGVTCLEYPLIMSGQDSVSGDELDVYPWLSMVDVLPKSDTPSGISEIKIASDENASEHAEMPFFIVRPAVGGGRMKDFGVLSKMFEPDSVTRFVGNYKNTGASKAIVSMSFGGSANTVGIYENYKCESVIRIICSNFLVAIDTESDAYESIVGSALDNAIEEHHVGTDIEKQAMKKAMMRTFKAIACTLVASMVPKAINPRTKNKEYVFHFEATPILTTSPLMVLPFVCAFIGSKAFYHWTSSYSSSAQAVPHILADTARLIGEASYEQQMQCMAMVKCRKMTTTTTTPKLSDYFAGYWYPATTAKTKNKNKQGEMNTNYRLFLMTFTRLVQLAAGEDDPAADDQSDAPWDAVAYKKIRACEKFSSSFTFTNYIELARAAIKHCANPKAVINTYSSFSAIPFNAFLEDWSGASNAASSSTSKEEDETDDEKQHSRKKKKHKKTKRSKKRSRSNSEKMKPVEGKGKTKHRHSVKEKKEIAVEEVVDDGVSLSPKRTRTESSHDDVGDNKVIMFIKNDLNELKTQMAGLKEQVRLCIKSQGASETKTREKNVVDAERLMRQAAKLLDGMTTKKNGKTVSKKNTGRDSISSLPEPEPLLSAGGHTSRSSSSSRKRSREMSDDDDDLFDSSSDEEVCISRPPSTRKSRTITTEELEANISKIDEFVQAEDDGDGEDEDEFVDYSSEEEDEDDDEEDSSGVDLCESDEEDKIVEDVDTHSLRHIFQDDIDLGKGPEDGKSIIITSRDVALYQQRYLKSSDKDFDPKATDSTSLSTVKLSREKKKAMDRYMTTCIMGPDLCLARAKNDGEPVPIHVLGQMGMRMEPTKEHLKNPAELAKFIEFARKLLKCSSRARFNVLVNQEYKSGLLKNQGTHKTPSNICVCDLCRSVLSSMSKARYINYFRKHFFGDDEEEGDISAKEIYDSRRQIIEILSACPKPLPEGMFDAKHDLWCAQTGTAFYKKKPSGKQIALVRVSPQERAVGYILRNNILGKPIDKPVYYEIPVVDGTNPDEIFCPGSISRRRFEESIKKWQRALEKLNSKISDMAANSEEDDDSSDASDDEEYEYSSN